MLVKLLNLKLLAVLTSNNPVPVPTLLAVIVSESVISFVPCATLMPVVPTKLLNCNSEPDAWANTPLPDPRFAPVVVAPAVVSKLLQAPVFPKYASIVCESELYLISPTSVLGL